MYDSTINLIGLHGYAGAGKDAVFNLIKKVAEERYELALRRAFADPMKISGMRALGFTARENMELVRIANEIKDTGRITVTYCDSFGVLQSKTISGRNLWQKYGTEAHRSDDLGLSFGPEFWVDNILPVGEDARGRPAFIHMFKEEWAGFADWAVLTDVRFENEAQRIIDLGGEIWRVDADKRMGISEDGHPSEVRLDEKWIAHTIDNNGTPAELELNVRALMPEKEEIYE